jgi:capsular polysaccharide biosynthesis protein
VVSNVISADAFDGMACLLDQRPKYIVKNHVDANNYWHWTFEWLPRLFVLRDLIANNADLEEVSLLNIGPPLNVFQLEWLDILFGEYLAVSSYNSPVLCDNLIWVTPPFPAHHNRETVLQIRSHILSPARHETLQVPVKYPSRIYLLRGNARNGRRIRNEPELIDGLKRFGFVAMAMDGLSVYEQAQVFLNADIIVGAHGSAFVNMIYCRPSCKIIELFGPGYISGHDYSLASVCGLDWEYIEGESVEGEPAFASDFYVDYYRLLSRLLDLLNDLRCP